MIKIKLITEKRVYIYFTDFTYGTLARPVIGSEVEIPDGFLANPSQIKGALAFVPEVRVDDRIRNEDEYVRITLTRKGQGKKSILVPARLITCIKRVSSTVLMRYYC